MKTFTSSGTPKLCVDYDFDYPVEEKGLLQGESFSVYNPVGEAKLTVAVFRFEPLPGCCGVVVSTASYINTEWRGSWVGPEFHKLKEELAKNFGYSLLLATTQLSNIPEVVSSSKARWRIVKTFLNKRTSRELGVMMKNL